MGVVAEVTPPKELRLPTPPSAEVSRFSRAHPLYLSPYIFVLKPRAIASLQ